MAASDATTCLRRSAATKRTLRPDSASHHLGVFGSVARDEADDQSDVDIVYETDSPNLFRAVRMKQELEALLRRRVDVVRWRERLNPRLKARIAREAVYV